VGLFIKGIAAVAKYFRGQATYPYSIETGTISCYRLRYNEVVGGLIGTLVINQPDKYLGSRNDLVFFKLNPTTGKHCGLTKAVLRGTLMATYGSSALLSFWPIADIEITLAIPWFVRG